VALSVARWWGHNDLAAINLHGITQAQLAPPAGFDGAIHPHVTALDPQLGLPSGANEPLKL
jgi:hypothetical protein